MPKGNSKSSTALTKWDAQLAALAQETAAMESSVGGVGNFLSIKSGVLSYQGTTIPDNAMRVVILDAILENQWYDTAFDPDNPTSPACYAFGRAAKEMTPHENSFAIQNADCPSCPQMQFGTADRGKGKACKAVQRVALLTEGDLENIEGAEIAYLKLPFYSTLEYAAYVKQLAEVYKKPPLAFVTEIKVVPDPKSQFRVKFKMETPIEDGEAIGALLTAREKAAAEIAFPYPDRTEAAASPAKRNSARAAVAPRAAAPKAAVKPRATAKPAAPPVAVAAAAAGKPVKVGVRPAVKAPKF